MQIQIQVGGSRPPLLSFLTKSAQKSYQLNVTVHDKKASYVELLWTLHG